MTCFAQLLLLVLVIAATVAPGLNGLEVTAEEAHLRRLQGDDQQPDQPNQPEQPEQPEQPILQPVMQPVMLPDLRRGASNLGGGYTTGDNTNTLGGTNEFVRGRCSPWPECRFWCVPGSYIWPRCRNGSQIP